MRVAVIRNGKPALSVPLSPQGWYAVDGGFTFELSDVFDEPHSVARKILDALSEKSDDLRIRITDDQNPDVKLEVTVPTEGRERDFQWLLRK